MKKIGMKTGMAILLAGSMMVTSAMPAFAITRKQMENAQDITAGSAESFLNKKSEKKVFKINVDRPGYFNVTVSPGTNTNAAFIKAGWKFKVYTASKKNIYTAQKPGVLSDSVTTPDFTTGAGTYYVEVGSNTSKEEKAPVNVPFRISANASTDDSCEHESYNSSKIDTEISIDRTCTGNLYTSGDVDWYKFTLDSPQVLRVNFNRGADRNTQNGGKGWKISLYTGTAGKKKLLTYMDNVTDSAVLGKTRKSGDFKKSDKILEALPAGNYFVKVQAGRGDKTKAPVFERYHLLVNNAEVPEIPQITSVTSEMVNSKRYVTIQWNPVYAADSFEIYRTKGKAKTLKKAAEVSDSGASGCTFQEKSGKGTYTYYIRSVKADVSGDVFAASDFGSMSVIMD